MFHISDINRYEKCTRLFMLHRRSPKGYIPFLAYNENMISLVKQKLKIKEVYEGKRNDPTKRFFTAINQYDVFINARFEFDSLRIKIPVLIKEADGFIAYFVYESCYPKENNAIRMADTLWVLKQLHMVVKESYVIHLNARYIKKDTLHVDELLMISPYLFNEKNKQGSQIKELLNMHERNLTPILKELHQKDKDVLEESERKAICTKRHRCVYYDLCFPEALPKTSILHLVQSKNKYKMYEEGIKDIVQVDVDQIEGTRVQYAQIMATRDGGFYCDIYALKTWLKESIVYPISYVDFEWETFVYPPYAYMHPYDVMVFQYSLHIEEEDGTLHHKEFLDEGDTRIDFIESLLENMPKTGSILAFNVDGAERLRLKQLASVFPQYHDALEAIWIRMVDLSQPFSSGCIYDTRMEGMFSLKKLVSIFSDYSYDNLDISHGLEAVEQWRSLSHASQDEKDDIVDHLLQYCKMDTYAMYILLHYLMSL